MSAIASDDVLYVGSPVMFRSRPVRFVVASALVPFGVGALALARWFLDCRSSRLTVTGQKTSLRKGILSRDLNEVRHDHIRNVQLYQTFFQRIFNVGKIAVSSSGQGDVEIEIDGIRDPLRVKRLIEAGSKGTASREAVAFDWLPVAAFAIGVIAGTVALSYAWAFVANALK